MSQICKVYEVGGCVRDSILSIPSKDVDFVVVAPSYDVMRAYLVEEGFKIYIEKPEYVTIRCNVPAGHPLRVRTKDADFVLARKDGPSSDGRRPDYVEPGTLLDDLSRRDFTINAIARDPYTNELVDPFHGVEDLKTRTLRFVGNPYDRIREDGLRVMRGIRFSITKNLSLECDTEQALYSVLAATMLNCVSIERIREELEKMLAHDTLLSLTVLAGLPQYLLEAIFRSGLRLSASLKS